MLVLALVGKGWRMLAPWRMLREVALWLAWPGGIGSFS